MAVVGCAIPDSRRKCLPATTTEVVVKLRKPPLDNLAGESSNHFRFRLGPGEISLSLNARVKRPGEELVSMPAQPRQSRNTPRTRLMPMSIFWEMPCMEMPCCSCGKTQWKRLGRSSSPSSRTPQLCIHTSQDRGDLMKRPVWLWTWAAGMNPVKRKENTALAPTPA
jgi:hypothetical protein